MSRIRPPTASGIFFLAVAMSACGDSPTDSGRPAVGSANLTLEMPGGTRTASGVEAAYYVYNPGPTPETRAMYLMLGTRERNSATIWVELFQFLPDNVSDPVPGTYGAQYGALGGNPTMGGSVLTWIETDIHQLFPAGPDSHVTLESVTSRRISGSLRLTLGYLSGTAPGMTLHGTFVADRVDRFEDLPHLEP